MKRINLNLGLRYVLSGLLFLIFISCERIESENPHKSTASTKTEFSVINGYLVFESKASFLKTSDRIANLSDKEREKWENKIGFYSQRRMIMDIIEDELIQDKINEVRFSDVDINLLNKDDLHSDAYKNALAKGVIKVIKEGTEDEYWDFTVFNRGFVDFINEDGLFAIGDTLYQVTNSYLKAMKPADISSPDTLLQTKVDDQNNNIVFCNMESKLKASSPGLIESNWVADGSGKKGEKRIKVGIYLAVQHYIISDRSYDFLHNVYVQCQERNFWRKWKYKGSEVWINGSWTVSVYYFPQRYSNTYSYNNKGVAYYKASINPETGSTAPYESYFHVSPNSMNRSLPSYMGDQYNYQPIFQNYNWSATRPGGCCGLTATLIK
jgi:hypothetical protein